LLISLSLYAASDRAHTGDSFSQRAHTLLRQAAASREPRGALIKTTHQQINLLYGAINFSISLQLYAPHSFTARNAFPVSQPKNFCLKIYDLKILT